MYDSYNVELASTHIQNLTIENASKTYSISNEIKLDVSDKNHKYNLYRQSVPWICKGILIQIMRIMKISTNFQTKM